MSHFQKIRLRFLVMLALTAMAATAVACGGASEDAAFDSSSQDTSPGFRADSESDTNLLGLPGGSGPAGAAGPSGRPAAQATGTPAPPQTVVAARPQREDDGKLSDTSDSNNSSPPLSPLDEQVVQISSNRIIVRNVDMSIEVTDTAAAVEEISALAVQQGGWTVRTQNIEVHRGSVDIRVPSDRLDDVLRTLRNIASNVVTEISTSQDFTEEFTDTNARVQTLQDTVDALRALFIRAEKIEDALTIQKEITRVQSDIESMQARINFLSESAAFSLIRISVLALPQQMIVTAGEDKLAAVGRSVRFRAEFTPPEGIENFFIEWDFGDGTSRQVVTGVAPLNVDGRVISAPVVHGYNDDIDSPYIVKVRVSGTGESGAAEGEDVMVVTVNRVPPIEVFAGENRVVDEGEELTLRGTFTRPDGVESLRYTWDFGDSTAPVTVDADPDATAAEITHKYANSRSQNYNVILTVNGETPAGSTEGTGTLQVRVEEPESLTAGGFAPGDNGRTAFRALSSIGTGLLTVGIWLGVLSPIWLIAGGFALVLYRSRNRNIRRRSSERMTTRTAEGTTDS